MEARKHFESGDTVQCSKQTSQSFKLEITGVEELHFSRNSALLSAENY